MNLKIGIRMLRDILPADATNALNRLTISEGDDFMWLKLECAHGRNPKTDPRDYQVHRFFVTGLIF